MTALYPDEIEYLEMQEMNKIEPDPIDDYQHCHDHQRNIPEAYLEFEPVPIFSDSNELEPTERGDLIIQLESALDKQAPTIDADFSLDKMFPATIARVIHKSSLRSQSDTVALSMMLMAATAGLLGSKVRVNTQYGTPFASNLYIWLVGDTSSKKSKIAKKITNPLFGVKVKEHARINEAIAAIKNKDLNPERKREEIEQLKNNQRLQFFESRDISEQGLIKQLSRQAPLQGLHMHLDEGSDLFNGVER